MEFNEKLQTLRTQKGLTQEELAKALFVSRTAISKWESGKGYPNIESLKALSGYFGISIDTLLSGDELLSLAQEATRENEGRLRDLVFGLLDCSSAMFFFLPFFGLRNGGVILSVSLLGLTSIAPWLKAAYFLMVASMIGCGIATLALQNCSASFWLARKGKLSLLLNAAGVLLYIITLQPYAAVFLFIFLALKGILLAKKQ